ncbi:alkene reductase [Lentibacter algarum]|uniref:alkene reductase n=1 Tax=Lentibacter algarum TaxID=576131 RepID=UPI001C06925F|nr:alkene reductase [Lentibacter algarum]MBU2981040.1 alkene reductase [Lentibacter algarum]
MSILFEPTNLGRYTVPNRIIMAPMSRNRARKDGVVTDVVADYYGQRATAGLIISESIMVNDWANGMCAPGLYNAEQIAAWKTVTDRVHEKGGLIFAQLWHAGRAAHDSLMPEGRDCAGPSAIGISREIMTFQGPIAATPPRALTLDEISELRTDFAQAAKNALEAGFDGVEIHAAAGYLIDQFLQDGANQRDDIYGGSAANRYRFLNEITDDAIAIWGSDRVGVRLSPKSDFNDMHDSDPVATFTHVISALNTLNLAYLHLSERLPFVPPNPEDAVVMDALRKHWDGPLISNGDFDAQEGAAHIDAGKATMISYGRPFISNPDLPARFKASAELTAMDPATIYGGDARGYTDYPPLAEGSL